MKEQHFENPEFLSYNASYSILGVVVGSVEGKNEKNKKKLERKRWKN